ncbi:hypothetical protein Avbf_11770 [Armadillidium vulgare]|nr:hypothetical protein Avbf_11770 [Armadillidium vulgare]
MASWASAQEVLNYIQKLGILKAKLKDSDIESILDGLYYEGKLDQSHTSTSGDKSYRFKINICGDVGLYSSLNCKYMKEFEF